jgi:hypothetical protein
MILCRTFNFQSSEYSSLSSFFSPEALHFVIAAHFFDEDNVKYYVARQPR